MEKTLRKFLVALLAALALIFTVIGLTACNSAPDGLVIENAKNSFVVDDVFELGPDFTVYQHYKDGKKVKVDLADVSISGEYGIKPGETLDEEGDFQITVSYGKLKEVYTIYVNEFEPILQKIEIDDSSVQKSYTLGDAISFEGIKITLTRKNGQGATILTTVTAVREFKIEIRHDETDKVMHDEILSELGKYTVTISSGIVKASYKVSVDKADLSTIAGAIAVAKQYQREVVSGVQDTYKKTPASPGGFPEFHYEYKFGDNYTYIKDTLEELNERHMSIVDDEFTCVTVRDGQIVNNGAVSGDYINGPRTNIWYNRYAAYGPIAVLESFYTQSLVASNNDLEQTVNEETKEYSFKFSGLVINGNLPDFFKTEVTFRLGEKLNLEYMQFQQQTWENNTQNTVSEPTFITDSNGITKPNGRASDDITTTITQVTGNRTATNPYLDIGSSVKSFDFVYEDEVLPGDAVIEKSVADVERVSLQIAIENIVPASVNFNVDEYTLYFRLDGDTVGYVNSNGGMLGGSQTIYVYRTGNTLNVYLYNGGTYKVLFKCGKITKSITFEVTGKAPTSMTAQIRNNAGNAFMQESTKTVGSGEAIYFKGEVNKYANPAQTATVTSSNASKATIEEVTENGVKCFKFTATEAGAYTVKVTSTVNSQSCTFTFTVRERPAYATILNGKYTCTDTVDDYEVEFIPSSAGAEEGIVKVTKISYNDDGSAETGRTTEQLSYVVEGNEIKLTHVSGTALGAGFSVSSDGKLTLITNRGFKCAMTKA